MKRILCLLTFLTFLILPAFACATISIEKLDPEIHTAMNYTPFLPVPSTGGGIVFFESFEQPASNDYDNSGWIEYEGGAGSGEIDPNSTTITHTGYGQYVLKSYVNDDPADKYQAYTYYTLDSALDYCSVVFHFYVIDWPGEGGRRVFALQDSSSTDLVRLITRVSPGQMSSKIYISGLYDTENWDMTTGAWHYIEIFFQDSTNTCTVYCDGVQKHTYTSCAITNVKTILCGHNAAQLGGTTVYFDDIAVRDWDVNAALIGDFSIVDDIINSGSDSTYLYTYGETNAKLLGFTFDNTGESSTPKCVRIGNRAQYYDADHSMLRACVRISGTNYNQDFQAGSAFEEQYGQWEENPDTETAWTIANINALEGGVVTRTSSYPSGVKLSDVWADVFWGSTGDGFVTHAPYFHALNSTSIRGTVRVNEETNVKIRYGTNEANVKSDTGDTQDSSAYTATSATDYWVKFDITSLSADTQYYFDIMVQQSDDSYQSAYALEATASVNNWNSLPTCKTDPTEGSTDNQTIAAAGDPHSTALHYSIYDSIATAQAPAAAPRGFIQLGDEWLIGDGNDSLADIREVAYNRRGYHCEAWRYSDKITSRMSVITWVVSDHNHIADNSNKVGDGEYINGNEAYLYTYNSWQVINEITPLPDLFVDLNFEGTASGGSTTTLTCTNTPERQFTYSSVTGGTPAEGDSVSWNAGSDTGELIHYDSDDSIMIVRLNDSSSPLATDDVVTDGVWSTSGSLSNIYYFPTVSKYGLYKGMMIHNKTDGSYMVLKTNDGSTLTACSALEDKNGDTGSDFDSDDDFTITRATISYQKIFGNTLIVVYDQRFKRDPNGTYFSDTLDGVVWGPLQAGAYKATGTAEAGTDTDTIIDSGVMGPYLSTYVCKYDGVVVYQGAGPTVRGYSMISEVTDNDTIELDWPVVGLTNGDTFEIYESGGSDHTQPGDTNAQADKRNINNGGHVIRTLVEQAIRDANRSTYHWLILAGEKPFHHAQLSAWDKWCDFDGCAYIGSESSWTLDGSQYYASGYTVAADKRPGGVYRKQTASGTSWAPLELMGSKAAVTDIRKFFWDPATGYIWIADSANQDDVRIFHYEHWNRVGQRRFMGDKYVLALNDWFLCADRHFGALDDGSHPGDIAYNVNAAPLHVGIVDKSHYASMEWDVGGSDAMYDRGMGPGADTTQIGGWALIEIKNDEGKMTISLRERDGAIINNGTQNLTMDISFISYWGSENIGTGMYQGMYGDVR